MPTRVIRNGASARKFHDSNDSYSIFRRNETLTLAFAILYKCTSVPVLSHLEFGHLSIP